jgi:hypothetical protein
VAWCRDGEDSFGVSVDRASLSEGETGPGKRAASRASRTEADLLNGR